MTKIVKILRYLLLGVVALNITANAASSIQEAEIAREIKKNRHLGEIIELTAGDHQFLAIYQETALPVKQGGLIILHGTGQNPDSPAVIHPIRTGLTDSGWDTLSLQMPVVALETNPTAITDLQPEASLRIQAAIQFFTAKNNVNVSILGHDSGAALAVGFLGQSGTDQVRAVALLSINGPEQAILENLQKIDLPILDLYGTQDFEHIKSMANDRKRAVVSKGENRNFRQITLEGGNHYYDSLQQSLLARVRAWLGKQAAGAQVMLNNGKN
jgi:acetyl esterase/lipase